MVRSLRLFSQSTVFRLVIWLLLTMPLPAYDDSAAADVLNMPETAPEWLSGASGVSQASYLFGPLPEASVNDVSQSADSETGSGTAEATTFESELSRLQMRIDQLEASEKKRVDGEKKKKEEEAKKAEGWQDMSTDKWTVKLGGHVQLEYINWANADPAIPGTQDYFEFRRLRLVADGTGYGQCDFRLQMTLEPETVGTSPAGAVTSPDVKDAYFSMNEIPGLGRIRIGNFFVPFSLEQVTNDTNNIFMERSIPSQGVFAADREVGIALYNCTDDQSVTWASGVFFDSISEGLKERIDDNQGCRVSGRLDMDSVLR
ncbi:MAG: porin [Planctomycetaceae bacterium]